MVGDNLKKTRIQKGLTLSALSKLAGLDIHTISKIEQGRIPYPSTIKKISEALQIKPEKLYK